VFWSRWSLMASRDPPGLQSFPTRRSSDLVAARRVVDGDQVRLLLGEHVGEAARGLFDVGVDERVRRPVVGGGAAGGEAGVAVAEDRKSTRLNSSHVKISYAVFCLKKKNRH